MCRYPKVVVFKEKVYIGWQHQTGMNKLHVVIYDPKQDSYSMLSPYTYKYFSMAVVNNQLVLVGGKDLRASKTTNTLGVWNEQSN